MLLYAVKRFLYIALRGVELEQRLRHQLVQQYEPVRPGVQQVAGLPQVQEEFPGLRDERLVGEREIKAVILYAGRARRGFRRPVAQEEGRAGAPGGKQGLHDFAALEDGVMERRGVMRYEKSYIQVAAAAGAAAVGALGVGIVRVGHVHENEEGH